ncbi:MAG: amidohydrolase family protein [Anaerovoracaceae bacterium]|jgi:predicted amidohydrolase YtcJ
MAFGLFKKSISADLILRDGVIVTQDPDLPVAEAVAVKDELILAVGSTEEMMSFSGKETDEIDLGGAFLFPGFINSAASPVTDLFSSTSAILNIKMSIDEVLQTLNSFVSKNPDYTAYFGFGYDESLFTPDTHLTSRGLLDRVCSDKPILLLSNLGQQAWANSLALEMAEARAKEEAIMEPDLGEEEDPDNLPSKYPGYLKDPLPGIQVFTRDEEGWPTGILIGTEPIFIVASATDLFDADQFYQKAMEESYQSALKGYTSLIDVGAPDFLHTFYMDLLQETLQEYQLKQRYFGCLLNNKGLNAALIVRHLMRKNTLCMECGDLISVNCLRLVVESRGWESSITEESLKALCLEAGDRGFDVHIEAYGTVAITNSIKAFSAARNSGYKKNRFILTADETIADTELLAILRDTDAILDVIPGDNPQDWLDYMTTNASYRIRMEDKLGSIQKGKYADFTILATDPLKTGTPCKKNPFEDAPIVMTILEGRIVYQK